MTLAQFATLGVLAAVAVGMACEDPYGSGGCTAAAAPNVNISSSRFCPASRTISTGTSVTWTNLDGITHTSTSDVSSTESWSSGSLAGSGTFSHQFNTPGTFPYHCAVHSSMHGTIIVQ
jgi:plastocyanin